MPSIRSGFGSDFVLKSEKIGIGSTTPTSVFDVAGAIKGDFAVTGVATLTSYGGFVAQNQHINKASSIGFATVGLQTAGAATGVGATHVANQYYETETGFTDLGGVHHGDDQYFNTLSEDLIVDDGQILNITNTEMVGLTTIGEYDRHNHSSYVCAGSLEQVSVTDHFSVPNGGINDRQETSIEGTVRFNTDLNTLEFFNGNEWRQFTYNQGQSGRTVIAGSGTPAHHKTMHSVQTTSLGNSIYFGDLSLDGGYGGSAMSNGIRGLTGGGWDGANNNDVEYVTLASGGNGIDFGADTDQGWGPMGASTSTRGISAGGGYPSASTTIKSFFFSSTGVREDFGNLPSGIDHRGMGDKGPNSPTRGLFCGGYSVRRMESKELHSDGDTVLFGDLVSATRGAVSASDQTRGILFSGWDGASYIKKVDYVTMASFGNAVEFGDMDLSGYGASGGNMTRALYFRDREIQYVEIQSQGNAIDFGDIGYNSSIQALGLQDSHGGLGGF